MIHTLRAIWHWLRLGYYNLAIDNMDPEHPDLFDCCMKAVESQRIVEDFLSGRAT